MEEGNCAGKQLLLILGDRYPSVSVAWMTLYLIPSTCVEHFHISLFASHHLSLLLFDNSSKLS